MSLKIIDVIAPVSEMERIAHIAQSDEVLDWWRSTAFEDERFSTALMVRPEEFQMVLDRLQAVLDNEERARIIIRDIETTLPKIAEPEPKNGHADEQKKESSWVGFSLSREELYEQLDGNARLTPTYLLLCGLSAVVAALGMIENNVAVVIGAMVIAPLLGPNLALALGTTLGDMALSRRAISVNLTGLALSVGLALLLGLVLAPQHTHELMGRAEVGYPAMVLALASGAAAVLSMTAGVAAGLVGVMVAVALMPPATALGLFLGWGEFGSAAQAGLLLAINIASINLSAKLVFVLKGVSPRRWPEKSRARRSSRWSFLFWSVSLILLAGLVWVARYS